MAKIDYNANPFCIAVDPASQLRADWNLASHMVDSSKFAVGNIDTPKIGPETTCTVHTKSSPELRFSGDTFVLDTSIAAALEEYKLYLPVLHKQIRQAVVSQLERRKLTTKDTMAVYALYRELGVAVRVLCNASATRVQVELQEISSTMANVQLFGEIDEEYFTAD